MSEQDTENKREETSDASKDAPTSEASETTSASETPETRIIESESEPKAEVDVSDCDACRAALNVACEGLCVNGMVVINEMATKTVVVALKDLGLKSDVDDVKKWIDDAANAGVTNINWLAEFLCKKAEVC